MEWVNAFSADRQPTDLEIAEYIASPLWGELQAFISENYRIEPGYAYSACTGQPGWNIKYRRAGRSLCTLYPMSGFFIALVVVGAKEQDEAELSMPLYSEYTRELFAGSVFSAGGRWLMIHVTEQRILDDVKRLIQLRCPIKKKV